MPILTTGNAAFDDISLPVSGKSEFGMDTLTRKTMGARAELPTYLASLHQGDVFTFNDVQFFLQSWDPNDATPFASVALYYKGLIAGVPVPDIITEIVSAAGSVSKSFADENNGKGRYYDKLELGRSATSPDGYAGDFIEGFGGGFIAYRKLYALSAQMEFTYDAVQTVYRYIAASKPGGPANSKVDIKHLARIRRARITTSDGALLGKAHASAFNLVPVELEAVISFSCKNVIGSNYYECQDVVRKELVQPEVIT